MVKSEPKKKPQSGGFFQKFFRKPEKSQKEQRLTVQRSIPYLEMGRDGICRVEEHLYSKTVRFYDINYQLAQNEDKNTIFESWCDFLNYFDASIRFQLSFMDEKGSEDALGVDEDAAETEVADRPRQPMNYAGRVAERTADDVRKPSVLAQLHAKQAERTAEPQKSQKRKSHNMEL